MMYHNSRTSDVQKFLSERFLFRYNIVLAKTEYQIKDGDKEYKEITDYEINTISLSMEKVGLNYGTDQLRKLLNSEFVPKYDPFQEYLNNLPAWNGQDYIGELANTVNTTKNELFSWVFRKWLVAVVASLIDNNIINHTVLVFVGKQGKGKSTWIRKLIPTELKEYYYEGVISPSNKDDKFQLAENMVINLDELQSLRPSDIEALKGLITSTQVKLRRPYARTQESMPRRASFTGSVNHKEFLTDTTGNRRFLCFETESIDYENNVPIDGVYAQALHLYKDGFQYWFDEKEISLINENNNDFMSISVEEDLLLQYLEPCFKEDSNALFNSPTAILKELLILDSPNPEPRGISGINNPSAISLGKMLNKHGFDRKKVKGISGYYYKIKSVIEESGYGYSNLA